MTEATPIDVTDEFSGLNDYDRMFRTPAGFLAKVRVEDVSPLPTLLYFKVTGSWTDEDGKALVFGDGWFIVQPIEVAARLDSPDDTAGRIEAARLRMAMAVEAAAQKHLLMQALPGVKPKTGETGPDEPTIPPAPYPSPMSLDGVQRAIDRERDRRIDGGFTFMGHRFQSRPSDRENIMGAAQLAMGAIGQGAEPGNLRWANPDQDFVWITADNQLVPLDAYQVLALFQAGVAFKSALTFHARGLKDAAAEAEDLTAFEWRNGWPE